MDIETKDDLAAASEEKPFYKIIIHSFFVIPFLIAVFCVLLFAGMHLLTSEKRSAYDYLEDVKIGGINKRWQGAFELSKILANPKHVPKEERFVNEMISAFEHASHDDDRVRQYLALAMGRTQDPRFTQALVDSLEHEKEENLAATIYALGMLRQKDTAPAIYQYTEHPSARLRSISVVALGNIANPEAAQVLRARLHDAEDNVKWGAAVSLAHLGDQSGIDVLGNMLDRQYLGKFIEVDAGEQNQLILTALDAIDILNSTTLSKQVEQLAASDQNMKVRAKAQDILK